MTIFIDNEEMTHKRATKFISKPDDLVRQILRAWCQPGIKHCFRNKSGFDKAVHRNRKTLRSMARGKTDMLFTSSNHLFSTQATGREETLYFEDESGATKRTGRLRQRHRKGPLAKIDRKPRTHRFLSKKRSECVRERMSKWHDNKGRLPRFYSYEKGARDGEHHIEFSRESKKWHLSEGTVKTGKDDLDCRIASALENILGIRGPRIKK
jgi:hypothetical protein